MEYKYLYSIDSPADIRKLSVNELRVLAQEIREFLIDTISKIGGHLGSSLGSVELTLALHYVFDTPNDRLVWDVGHQGYIHKILTGRRDNFQTIRLFHGISGFLKRSESPYDVFGAGHASTSISAALGVATARDFMNEKYKVIAVIGDGAMTGGMAYEGMNNTGLLKKNLIVVLNDNRMSIAPNVWSISNYFSSIAATGVYNRFKSNVWELTGKLDSVGDRIRKAAARLETGMKAVVTPGMLFEALGFRYFGPFNGHNVGQLVKTFREVKDLKGPLLVHVTTEKGKGYLPAEEDKQKLHGVVAFDKVTGTQFKKDGPPALTKVFGEALVEIAKKNKKVVGVTAAMPDGTGLNFLQKELPDRCFDVGIAEQHAVTFCAGMATEGYIPVAAIYSTFLQRAFDQIIHDVALQHLHVVFVLDRGGLVGADGPTHHGAFDLTYLRLVPGMVVMSPKDENELRDMLLTAVNYKDGPIALRYPRGNAIGLPAKEMCEIRIGKGEILKKGRDVAMLAVGIMVQHAVKAADLLEAKGVSAEVVNMRFIKPVDVELVGEIADKFDQIVTVEDNTLKGGFGSAIMETLQEIKKPRQVLTLGLQDTFIEHGTPQELYELVGLDPEGIAKKVEHFNKVEGTKKSIMVGE
ncbi:MAG TPA: 1-deoxy-D-xylulose-5-phosphate synthase [Candidatus Acidoferrales bacterium]|nr:1-deoxy-D-xylulose-5-phosphate synthase [Candidatus Acidoferrales bacterium]